MGLLSEIYSRWNEWISLPIRYCDLPLSSQITFTVWDTGGPRRAIPVGGSTFRLFGKKWLVGSHTLFILILWIGLGLLEEGNIDFSYGQVWRRMDR